MLTAGDTNWWKGAVIYQIYPRSYQDTTGNGVGDLPGIIDRLDYIADLGVDGIWISPFFTSPMADFGYDVADFRDVDPLFGTLADFDRLLEKAHSLGLKVVIDQIYSHTSDQHAWFEESRQDRTNAKADWFVWADPAPGGGPPTNWQSFFYGPAWTWDARRGQYYMHNFLPEQPDLNLWNPDVRTEILDTLRFWLDRGVDGVRLDAISHYLQDPDFRDNPPKDHPAPAKPSDLQDMVHTVGLPQIADFMAEIRTVLDDYPGRFAVGEIGGADPLGQAITYADPARTLQTYYSFTFLFQGPLTPTLIRDGLEDASTRHPEGWPTQVFSNHDATRAVTRWATKGVAAEASPAFAQLLNLMLLSLRGSVCLYQGEELGLNQTYVPYERLVDPEAIKNWPRTLGRDGARTPMPWDRSSPNVGFSTHEPWLPIDSQHPTLAVDQQDKNDGSTLNLTRAFLAVRKTRPVLKTGEIEFIETNSALLAFDRFNTDERLTCLFNLSDQSIPFQLDPHRLASLAKDLPQRGVLEGSCARLPAHGFLFVERSH